MSAPATLDHAGIAARIPHSGRMCLLDRLVAWSPERIDCRATSHRDADHPLRTAGGLLACHAIEYAAQAMALHGGLVAPPDGEPSAGYLASVRGVRFAVSRLDDIDGELQVEAERLAGDDRQVMYRFRVGIAAAGDPSLGLSPGRLLAEGRATVVLNTPLPATPQP